MPGGEPPLHVQVDQRKDLGVVQLLGQGRGIGVFADPAFQLGIAQQAGHAPFLTPLVVQHVPFRHGLDQPAQRLLQRVHVVAVVPDHQAQGPRVDLVAGPRHQRVIGVQQQHVGQLALQQRQLARHVDRRHMLLDRTAPERAGQLVAGDVVHEVCHCPAYPHAAAKGTLRQQPFRHPCRDCRDPEDGHLASQASH